VKVLHKRAPRASAKSRAVRPAEPAPARPRAPVGRPPKLSRERILRHALHLIESERGELPTLGRIVDDLGVVPSALYRHFRSRDELLAAVLALVLGDLELEIRAEGAWTEQVADWMRSLYRHLMRTPGLLPLLGDGAGHTSEAWQAATARVVRILERAGFRGRELALAGLFVAQATIGAVLQQGSHPLSHHIASAFEAMGGVAAPERVLFAQFLSEAAGLASEDVFEFAVGRAVASLCELRAGSA